MMASTAIPQKGEIWISRRGDQRRTVVEVATGHSGHPAIVIFLDRDGEQCSTAIEQWTAWVQAWGAMPDGRHRALHCPTCGRAEETR